MIRKNKLKILSVLSSACLWFYVMAVVNPEVSTSFEGLPVNISNTVELAENNLILSSDTKPTIDIILEGKVSDLRNLKKENIRASIEIQNPSEGKNEANILISVPNDIKYKIKESSIIVQLEKNIYTNKDISIELPKDKEISDYSISLSYNSVKISGPRSVIKKVDRVVASIKEDSFALNKNIGVQLKVLDSKGVEIENAVLENSIIEVNIKKIEQKEVNIVPVFDKEIDLEGATITPNKILISGESSLIKDITFLNTEKISINTLKNKGFVEVEIELPDGISIVKNNTSNNINEEPINTVLISLENN